MAFPTTSSLCESIKIGKNDEKKLGGKKKNEKIICKYCDHKCDLDDLNLNLFICKMEKHRKAQTLPI